MSAWTAVVAAGTAGATALAAHAAVNARLLRDPYTTGAGRAAGRGPAAPCRERVRALVPARDEAGRIGPCVGALLASRGLADLEVVVLDDGSTDGTAAAARRAAAGDGRLRVLRGRPLPPGWLGKPHACQQLADAAAGDVWVFVDADVVVEPHGLAASVALLRRAGLDAVSPYPRQVAEGAGPRLVQPLLQWSWLSFLPLRLAERSPRPSLAAAGGQLLVVDAGAYRRAGGHAAVRRDVLEDVALARALKRAGLRVALADGTSVAACRMYERWGELREGYSKSLRTAFGSAPGAAAVVAALALLYVVPPVAAVRGLLRRRPGEAAAGLAGYLAGVAGRVVAARRTGGRPGDALAQPLSVTLACWLVARSWWLGRRGRLRWKGRPLPAAGA